MKKKLSLGEKKLIRTILAFVLVQIIIIFSFMQMLNNSHQIDIRDTKQVDIVVSDIYAFTGYRNNTLLIVANSTKFLFSSHSTSKEYSVSELYDVISIGDKLSLRYYEVNNIWGKSNVVVEARSETEVYRSIEENNRGRKASPIITAIMFSIIEFGFIGVVFVYIWLNKNTIKGLTKKVKKWRKAGDRSVISSAGK